MGNHNYSARPDQVSQLFGYVIACLPGIVGEG